MATTCELRTDADIVSTVNNGFQAELLTLIARFETAQVTGAVRVAYVLARKTTATCILRTLMRARLASVGNNDGGRVWRKHSPPKCKTGRPT